MSDARRESARARREAADWFTRLSRRAVTTEAIRDFRDWRSDPENRAAYERMEAVWDRAGALADDPDIVALREETRRRTRDQPRARRRAARWTLAAGLAVLCAVIAVFAYWRLPPSYESGIGEQRIVRLADGSTLRLNTDSRAVVRIGKGERIVRLERGEALFEVAHDPSRPFLVRAGKTEVRALGTVFDVRRRNGTVDVILLSGAVEVRGAEGPALRLRPNERAQVSEGAAPAAAQADARRLTSWTERRLTFERTPLAAAVSEVNRYSRTQVQLAAPDLAAAPVNGVFETGDAHAFAAAVSAVFDLQMEQEGSRIVLRRPPA